MTPKHILMLRAMIERSVILLQGERELLLDKLPVMTFEQMEKLESILVRAEKINWSEEMPRYQRYVEKVVEVSDQAATKLRTLSPIA